MRPKIPVSFPLLRLVVPVVGCLAGLTLADPAFASEGGGHHGGGSLFDLIPYWVNFLIYVGLLWYLLFRKGVAPKFWVGRREAIQDAVAAAQAELKVAEENLRLARDKFDHAEEEAARVREIILKEAAADKEALLAEARQKAEQVVERARQTIAAERAAGERHLQQDLADRVISRARDRLKATVSAATDRARRGEALVAFKRVVQ